MGLDALDIFVIVFFPILGLFPLVVLLVFCFKAVCWCFSEGHLSLARRRARAEPPETSGPIFTEVELSSSANSAVPAALPLIPQCEVAASAPAEVVHGNPLMSLQDAPVSVEVLDGTVIPSAAESPVVTQNGNGYGRGVYYQRNGDTEAAVPIFHSSTPNSGSEDENSTSSFRHD